MKKGFSLHIGLNAVDPDKYGGWDGKLLACENDANDTHEICKKYKYTTSKVILSSNATYHNVVEHLKDFAAMVEPGDLFTLSYSGHGSWVEDDNADEPDRKDETWVLYDREIVDDEIFSLLSKFNEDCRIFVLSDSCHSGSVVRDVQYAPILEGVSLRTKVMPEAVRVKTLKNEKYKDLVEAAQFENPSLDESSQAAPAIILYSGCMDNQYSMDGDKNGLFTEMLLKTWNTAKFRGTYRTMHKKILSQMPFYQSPQLFTIGHPGELSAMLRNKPFRP